MTPKRPLSARAARDEGGLNVLGLFRNFAEGVKVLGVVIAIGGSLFGAFKFTTLFVEKQEQLVVTVGKIEDRVKELETYKTSATFDKSRAGDTEKKLTDAIMGLAEINNKQDERLRKLEDYVSTQAVDKFRLTEAEKKTSDALVAITEINKNVMEMRIQFEKLAAQQSKDER